MYNTPPLLCVMTVVLSPNQLQHETGRWMNKVHAQLVAGLDGGYDFKKSDVSGACKNSVVFVMRSHRMVKSIWIPYIYFACAILA